MSKPWPDEVRTMVDALANEGIIADAGVCGRHDGDWLVFDDRSSVLARWSSAHQVWPNWQRAGKRMNAKQALDAIAESRLAPAAWLARRIREAVPTARVTTTTDGIEVSVGSKSARAMAADAAPKPAVEQAPPFVVCDLLERIRTKYPDAKAKATQVSGEWHVEGSRGGAGFCTGYDNGDFVWDGEHVDVDGALEMISLYFDRYPPKPPSLLERLREAVPGLEWEKKGDATVGSGGSRDLVSANPRRRLLCLAKNPLEPLAVDIPCPSDDEVVRIVAEWYAKTHPAPAAEQVTLPNRGSLGGVAIGNATLSPAAPQPSPRALDTDAAMQAASNQMLRARQQRDDELMSAHIAGADFGRGRDSTAVTINMSASVLDAEAPTAALTRAIDEQSKRQRSHEWQRSVLTRMLEDAKERGFKPPQPAGATTMTKALDQAKVDASEAALRTAAKQLAKAARDPLAGAVARHLAPGDDSMRAKVAALLETDAGLAMLKAVLSLALSAIPQAGTRGAAIAHELRVQAMADGADLALDVIAGPLREVVALYLQDPAGAPAAAPALDAPQAKSVEWTKAEQKKGAR